MSILLHHAQILAVIAITMLIVRFVVLVCRLAYVDIREFARVLAERCLQKRSSPVCRYCLFGRTEPATSFAALLSNDDDSWQLPASVARSRSFPVTAP